MTGALCSVIRELAMTRLSRLKLLVCWGAGLALCCWGLCAAIHAALARTAPILSLSSPLTLDPVATSAEESWQTDRIFTDAQAQRQKMLARLGAAAWHKAGMRGQGIKVAILDS